ncbi:MAG TPA: DUF4129 domain-containing protein [Micromonosporaceae bacterium]
MTRWWNEAVATLADLTPGGVPMLAFLSVLVTALWALAWYFWPAWLPWRWRLRRRERDAAGGRNRSTGRRFRWGAIRFRWRLRWRRRRRRGPDDADLVDLAPDQLPDLPAQVLALSADQLAAQGRFAEAVRERLRAMVRELIERGVIPPAPGWTVTELAAAATSARPALAPPLRAAVGVFSLIWYGLQPARAGDDQAMRSHAGEVARLLAQPVPVQVGPATSDGDR